MDVPTSTYFGAAVPAGGYGLFALRSTKFPSSRSCRRRASATAASFGVIFGLARCC